MGHISFQLDPETTDANNDGFIMDQEFQPLSMSDDGSDGGVVALVRLTISWELTDFCCIQVEA